MQEIGQVFLGRGVGGAWGAGRRRLSFAAQVEVGAGEEAVFTPRAGVNYDGGGGEQVFVLDVHGPAARLAEAAADAFVFEHDGGEQAAVFDGAPGLVDLRRPTRTNSMAL